MARKQARKTVSKPSTNNSKKVNPSAKTNSSQRVSKPSTDKQFREWMRQTSNNQTTIKNIKTHRRKTL